jgi:hypothetical protein
LVFLALVSCGGASISDVCERAAECEGYTQERVDDCIEEGEKLERAADNAGCGDTWDDYVDCIDANLVCEDGDAEVDGCDAEEKALTQCGTTTSPPEDDGACGFTCPESGCVCDFGPATGQACCDSNSMTCEIESCDTLCCT